MVRINDSTYVIVSTLALLVGGTMVFGTGTPTTTLTWFGYYLGISLIVAGILLAAGVVVRTNKKIHSLEDRIQKLEDKNSES